LSVALWPCPAEGKADCAGFKERKATMLRVEWIEKPEALAALRGDWNALTGGIPFRSWQWLHTWWEHYGAASFQDRQSLCTLAVYDGPRLIGVAPFYLAPLPTGGFALRLLGSGEVCSDYLSLLCAPPDLTRVATAVADWLTQVDAGELAGPSWLRLELENVLADDPAWAELAAQLETRGFSVVRQPGNDCWQLTLDEDWEAYKAELSKNLRKAVRLAEQNLFDTGRARLYTSDMASFDQAWRLFVDLHQRRWQSLGEPGCFASATYANFQRAAAQRLLEAGVLRLQWVELDGRPVAIEYQLQSAGVLYGYQSGIEPEALDVEPGKLSKIATFRAAIEEGLVGIDYLRGSEEYKRRWRFEPRAATDLQVLSRRSAAKLHNSVWQAGGRAKSWIKRGLQLAGLRKK